MIERILIGYDGGAQARHALVLGAALASRLDASLTLGTCLPEKGRASAAPAGEDAGGAEELLADALSSVSRFEPDDLRRRSIVGGPPAYGLRDLAVDEGADLIVIGSTHRGPIGRVLPGRTALRLVRDTPCPIAIAPNELADDSAAAAGDIAVAFDGTEQASRGLRFAAELALQVGATIRVIAVLAPTGRPPRLLDRVDAAKTEKAARDRERLIHAVEEATRGLPPALDAKSVLLEGFPISAISDYGLGPGGLLVTGSHGRGPLSSAVLGSVSDGLIDASPWPLIVVPPSRGQNLGNEGDLPEGGALTADRPD